MEPFSLGASALCGIAVAYAIHQNLKCLRIIPEELRSLSSECSRLEEILRAIDMLKQGLQHQGLASNINRGASAIVPILDGALVDAQTKLCNLQSFINYMLEKAQENNKGDHWQWIRKKNNIDRLRAELRSVRYDLAVRCNTASPEYFNNELLMIQHIDKEAIQFTLQQAETFSLERVKTEARLPSHEIWTQLYQEYQQAEWMSAFQQRPRIEAIQAPIRSESETCPIAQDPSSSWTGLLHCSCIGRRLPSSFDITLWTRGICSSIRTCYTLVALGIFSIAGSLTLALWRTINDSDIQGGFTLAQYILAVGALIIGCVLVLHGRTCSCWSSSSITGGNGTLPEGRPVELLQLR